MCVCVCVKQLAHVLSRERRVHKALLPRNLCCRRIAAAMARRQQSMMLMRGESTRSSHGVMSAMSVLK